MQPTLLSSKQPYLWEELEKTVIFILPLCLLEVFTIILLPERITELQPAVCLLAAFLWLPYSHLFGIPPVSHFQIQTWMPAEKRLQVTVLWLRLRTAPHPGMAHLQTNTKRETAISLYPDPELQSPVHLLTYSESQNIARTSWGKQPSPKPTLNSTRRGCSSATQTDISEQANYDFPVLLLCSPLAGAQGMLSYFGAFGFVWCYTFRHWWQAAASSKPSHCCWQLWASGDSKAQPFTGSSLAVP